MRRHPGRGDQRLRGQGTGPRGFGGRMRQRRPGPPQKQSGQLLIGRQALVRQHVVADDHGPRARPAVAATRAPATWAAQGRQDGQVRDGLRRDQQREHHEIPVAEPAAHAHPAGRMAPGQVTAGARERLPLGYGDRLPPARVEPGRVLPAPRLDDDVVPGGGEPAGEFGGVPGAPALVGMRRADQRDPHGCRPSHSSRPSPGSRPAPPGVMCRPVSARSGRRAGPATR